MRVRTNVGRLAILGSFAAAMAVAGCSGNTPSCTPIYVGSAGQVIGSLVSPASGATGVPTNVQSLILAEQSDYGIVLEATTGAATGQIQLSPTALPSAYPTMAPGEGSSAYYAVSVPTLRSGTTYAVGTDAGNYTCSANPFRQFGTFTTE